MYFIISLVVVLSTGRMGSEICIQGRMSESLSISVPRHWVRENTKAYNHENENLRHQDRRCSLQLPSSQPIRAGFLGPCHRHCESVKSVESFAAGHGHNPQRYVF
jgi:hypothetical protein